MLSQFYPPILGGIERHVQSLSAALAARGHHVAVVTFAHPQLAETEMDGQVRIYRVRASMQRLPGLFTTGRFHAPPFPDPETSLALRRIIRLEQPDIVHAHNWMGDSFLPIKTWSRARLVWTLHDCEMTCVQMRMMYLDQELCQGPSISRCTRCAIHHYGPLKGTVTLLGNTVSRAARHRAVDMFLPVSSAVADANHLTGSGLPYRVMPNFVPDDVAQAAPLQDPRLDALPAEYILQVGDLARDKGVETLLAAYAGLNHAPPLVLIGRHLPETPTQLPPNVTVIESLPHPLVMQAWRGCLFGTAPSLCLDACPTVTLEAMSCGKAVVASRIGGIIDQVDDGETGFLIPPGDVPALRHALATLIADPSLRARMGAAALQKVTHFQASTVVQQIESIYQTIWHSHSENPVTLASKSG